jgi:hypothetical protein
MTYKLQCPICGKVMISILEGGDIPHLSGHLSTHKPREVTDKLAELVSKIQAKTTELDDKVLDEGDENLNFTDRDTVLITIAALKDLLFKE